MSAVILILLSDRMEDNKIDLPLVVKSQVIHIWSKAKCMYKQRLVGYGIFLSVQKYNVSSNIGMLRAFIKKEEFVLQRAGPLAEPNPADLENSEDAA